MTLTAVASANDLGMRLWRSHLVRIGTTTAAVLVSVAVGGVAEGSLWTRHPLLTTVNLFATAGLIGTGSWLVSQPGQTGTGWALVLSGITRPLGWSDTWSSGPWPLYSVVFGYVDTVFAAWALLRYPDARLTRPVRWYFLIREALTNANKHAHAVTIDVIAARDGDHVIVCVRDDGVGGADAHGPGLERLRDRIEAHGGQMRLDSPSGQGTRITARIPCV